MFTPVFGMEIPPSASSRSITCCACDPISESDCEIIRLYASAVGHLCSLLRADAKLQASRAAEETFAARLTILSEATTELSKAEDIDALCRRTVELGRERLGFDRLSIWFLSKDRTTMLGSFGVDTEGPHYR